MKTILLTGGAGYIGSHMTKKLLQTGHKVVVFDNFSTGYREPLDILEKYGDLIVIEGDIRNKADLEELFSQYKFDSVFHFAAKCSVDESMKEPGLYFENNTVGTLNLLQAMQKYSVQHIVFSSTCAVYGNAQYVPMDEIHPTDPENPYGESKFLAERIIQWFSKAYGMHYAILRYFNVCGTDSDGEIGDSKKPSLLLVQNAVRGALGIQGFELTCPTVDTSDGTPIRDYIDIEDLISAHILADTYMAENDASLTVNLGTGTGVSVKEIIGATKQELGVDFDIKKSNNLRQGESAKLYANIEKANTLLGWKPVRNISESIIKLNKWYSNKPDGYDY